MATFIIKSVRANMILCTDGEMHAANLVGPGGWSPKVYKTYKGAERLARAGMRKIVELDDNGCEKR